MQMENLELYKFIALHNKFRIMGHVVCYMYGLLLSTGLFEEERDFIMTSHVFPNVDFFKMSF